MVADGGLEHAQGPDGEFVRLEEGELVLAGGGWVSGGSGKGKGVLAVLGLT